MAAEETELIENLDRKFRPIFEQYGEEGGIPLRVLREQMEDSANQQMLPASKVDRLLKRADEDQDGYLDYDEFVTLMTMEEAKGMNVRQLTKFQRLVQISVSSVVPRATVNASDQDVLEDYVDHYNCRPPPLFMILISLAELIIFIAYAIDQKNKGIPTTANSGAPLYSPLMYNPRRRYEAWRFLSYMFIHQGYTHIIFNLIFQLLIGLPLEMVHKWWRVGIVYSLGVIAGSIATSVTDSGTLLCGASGGCYALIGAHFAIIIMNWREMTHDWMDGVLKFILSAPVRLLFWSLFAAADIGLAIYNRYTMGPSAVGYAAHLGGALAAGVLIGIPVLKNIDRLPWERVLWWVCLVVYLLIMTMGILFNIFYEGYPPTDWRKCCPDSY
ncbi:hypothetical protein CAPTEDRAFT_169308 [Capitella teleta]|uniref:EF-hand domain-containing protein n=1 Tax=Capitella teleta TaxID=283909 RepID=R7TGY5_CAPTE|nr:hypothetical protein CAPTEDRAFT_169308 [Capitella teleta]|eukprot:ELT92969.1 hypothetical protein CAPTEDRAFT_169308 [Capitella teleta]